MKHLQIGDRIKFKDKTGEWLEGPVTSLESPDKNHPEFITVLCYKPSWNMDISCLVPRGVAHVIERKDNTQDARHTSVAEVGIETEGDTADLAGEEDEYVVLPKRAYTELTQAAGTPKHLAEDVSVIVECSGGTIDRVLSNVKNLRFTAVDYDDLADDEAEDIADKIESLLKQNFHTIEIK